MRRILQTTFAGHWMHDILFAQWMTGSGRGRRRRDLRVSSDEEVTRRSSGADGSRLQVLDQAAVVQYDWCGVRVVGARGSYDSSSVTPLTDALATAARECSRVVLDASGVTFADSALLNLLILTRQATDLRVA